MNIYSEILNKYYQIKFNNIHKKDIVSSKSGAYSRCERQFYIPKEISPIYNSIVKSTRGDKSYFYFNGRKKNQHLT